jgi:hypothetical protein
MARASPRIFQLLPPGAIPSVGDVSGSRLSVMLPAGTKDFGLEFVLPATPAEQERLGTNGIPIYLPNVPVGATLAEIQALVEEQRQQIWNFGENPWGETALEEGDVNPMDYLQ